MRTIRNKLTKSQQEELFIKLARAVTLLSTPVEGAEFLKDLLSESEVVMLARRLQIAELLIDGLTYEEIRERLGVGWNTIAKVQTWLGLYGQGYRKVINRISKKKTELDKSNELFKELRYKYPAYFWPQLLLEEVVKTANKREKHRLLNVVEKLQEKTALSIQLKKLLV
ncbi:MAG: Trp family transcriptional regulator [bacterium]|nr:Trp family transcriptional regulator [bacterium]